MVTLEKAEATGKNQEKCVQKSIQQSSMSSLSPVHLQRYLPMVINWTPTTGHIPCQGHPKLAYGTWPPSSMQQTQGNTSAVRWLFYLSLSSGVLKEPHPNMWQLVFANVLV